MKRRFFHALLLFLLASFLLTGCWDLDMEAETGGGSLLPETETPSEAVQEDVLLPASFSLPYLPSQTLDPITCPDGTQQAIGALLYEGLFELDETLTPQNVLCEAYSYQPDTFTYTFTLRSGVTFSDGSALTAADAAASLTRAKTSQRYGDRLAQVRTLSASDSRTLNVVLASGNTGFPALLDIPIVKRGTEQASVPIGTGPYFFSNQEDRPCLVSNPNWWRKEALPTAEIPLSSAASREIVLYQFSSYETQLLCADLTGGSSVNTVGRIDFQDADTTILQYIGFNQQRQPLQNSALRRALGLGINRSTVVGAFLSEHGTPTQFPVSPVSPLYPQALETLYSHDAFTSALERAGYAEGHPLTLTLLVNEENSFKVSVANYLADALSVYDVEIVVQALPWADYLAALRSGAFDLYYGEVKLPASWDLTALLSSTGALNYGKWVDYQTDQLLEAYRTANDPGAAMQSLCAYLQSAAPILPVCFKSTSVLTQMGVVDGLTPTMSNPFYGWTDCTVHLREP